ATAQDPLDERGVRRLLCLLDQAGDRSGALQAYEDFARRLRDELQAEPAAETRALADALRAERPAAASPASPPAPASPVPSFPSSSPNPPAVRGGTGSPAPAASIAVLPFVDMSPEPQAYFADGLTEELISALALIEGMQVTSRTSSFAFKDRAQPLRAVAAELGVATVLEGSVRCMEGRVRVVAQLIDAATDTHLWTDAFERPLRDVLAIQSQVAEQISRALRVELSPAARGRMDARPTGNARAFDLYLQGRHWWSQGSREAWPRAVECYRQAIEEDARFALAYCGLADLYLHTSLLPFNPPVPRAEALEKGRVAALRALELNEELGEAHAALGVARWYAWDWEGSERAFRRAVVLNPGYATAHQRWSVCLCAQGRWDEALREVRRAQELDPLSLGVAVDRALIDLRARRYALAIAQLERVLAVDPCFAPALHFLTEAYAYSGDLPMAARMWQRRGRVTAERVAELDALLERRDMEAYARAWACEAERNGAAPGVLAGTLSRTGSLERAWEQIERALEERDPVLADGARLHPGFDVLRQDPRWQDVLRRIGITDPPPVPPPLALPYPGWEPAPG
ncbi:MAG TPA: BTAD domain-containing putative transcriptional regulator, partial [Longimicrobium sp.]|nr:BTAD domain-containing putative transcriptional regulator [Longimicrobium sp.]